MDARAKLIARLRDKQGERPLLQFAITIGVDQAFLWRLFNDKGNKVQLGAKTLSAIQVAFPDLAPVISEYLTERGRPRVEQASPAA